MGAGRLRPRSGWQRRSRVGWCGRRVGSFAHANQKVVAYNAVIGEKQKDLEALEAMAGSSQPPFTSSEEEAGKQ